MMNGILRTLLVLSTGAMAASADDVSDLVDAITGADNQARMDAAKTAGSVGVDAIEALGPLVASDDYLVKRASKLALEKIAAEAGSPDSDARGAAAEAFLKLAQPDNPEETRREAIYLLGWVAWTENVEAIAAYLKDETFADAARRALQRIPGEAVAEAMIAAAPSVDDDAQLGLFYAIAERDADDAVPILMEAVKSVDPVRSWAAFDVLTRLGVAPLDIIPRTHAKDLAARKRYANGFLRAADVQLEEGNVDNAVKMYASVASFPVSDEHACAALIGLKNARSKLLIEHALGYLVEPGIAHAAESALIDAEIDGLDQYLKEAYGVTNAAKQRVLLKVLAARDADGIDRFLNEARHNESAMVRFTAQYLAGDTPTPETYTTAITSAPAGAAVELARTYQKLMVAEYRQGDAQSALQMAHVLAGPDTDAPIREKAFSIIEAIANPESAAVLRDLIGSAYQPDAESPFDDNKGLAVAAGRAYVAALAEAAESSGWAIDELGNVAQHGFHAEVTNLATERLNAILSAAFNVSALPDPFVYDAAYL
jgi:hypothetical protein